MPRHRGPVLVDTMVILEAHRLSVWRALAGGYRVETVEACVTETQTGFQRRRPEHQIDAKALIGSLAAIHSPNDLARAAVAMTAQDIALDEGERDLWAHALGRSDDWILCGPDKASLRLGVRLGHRERLVALERLLDEAGARPQAPLKVNHTSRWLDNALNELVLSELGNRP